MSNARTVYLRDVDGTGSMHPCAKGDKGATPYVREHEKIWHENGSRGFAKSAKNARAELDYKEQRASYNAQVAMGLQSDLVKATKRIEELERFVEYYRKRFFAMRRALRNWPALPDPLVLKQLKYKFPEDWERGKTMQREIRFEAIPPVCECEGGAGFWDRITNGAWREALSTQKGDTDE